MVFRINACFRFSIEVKTVESPSKDIQEVMFQLPEKRCQGRWILQKVQKKFIVNVPVTIYLLKHLIGLQFLSKLIQDDVGGMMKVLHKKSLFIFQTKKKCEEDWNFWFFQKHREKEERERGSSNAAAVPDSFNQHLYPCFTNSLCHLTTSGGTWLQQQLRDLRFISPFGQVHSLEDQSLEFQKSHFSSTHFTPLLT